MYSIYIRSYSDVHVHTYYRLICEVWPVAKGGRGGVEGEGPGPGGGGERRREEAGSSIDRAQGVQWNHVRTRTHTQDTPAWRCL